MISKIISLIDFSRTPVNFDFIMSFLIAKPVPSHIPCFGTTLFDIGVNKTIRNGVIGAKGGSWLRMTKGF